MLLKEKEKKQIDSWIDGIIYEIAFWERVFRNKKDRARVSENVSDNLKLGTCFENDVIAFIENKDENFKALDVGCAINYVHNPYINGKKFNLSLVDPLATFYNRILTKRKIKAPLIEFGMVEYLSSFCGRNSVDLIIIKNALDHSFNPVKGIFECLLTLQKGGLLHLKHRKNEAEHENYLGFHQYNIDEQQGNLIVYNRDERFNISEILGGTAYVQVRTVGNEVHALIEKLSDNNDFAAAGDDVYLLSRQLMYAMQKLCDFSFVLRYNLKLAYFRLAHIAVGVFNKQTKENLKKLLKKRNKQ